MAIEHGLTILSWYEDLGEEERPPEHLWADDQGLEQWWAHVKAKRQDDMPTSRGRTDHDPNDQAPQKHMVENDQARFLREAMA